MIDTINIRVADYTPFFFIEDTTLDLNPKAVNSIFGSQMNCKQVEKIKKEKLQRRNRTLLSNCQLSRNYSVTKSYDVDNFDYSKKIEIPLVALGNVDTLVLFPSTLFFSNLLFYKNKFVFCYVYCKWGKSDSDGQVYSFIFRNHGSRKQNKWEIFKVGVTRR